MSDSGPTMIDSPVFTRKCHVIGNATVRHRRARKDSMVSLTHELPARIKRLGDAQAPYCLRILGLDGRTLDLRVAEGRLWRAAFAMSGDGRGLIPVTAGNVDDLLDGRLQLGMGESIFSPMPIAFEPGVGMQVLSEGFEASQVLIHDFCDDLRFVDDVLHVAWSVPRREAWFPPGHGSSSTRLVLSVAGGSSMRDFSAQFALHEEREMDAFLTFQAQRHGAQPEVGGHTLPLEAFASCPLDAAMPPVEQIVSILASFGRQHALATELSDRAFESWVRTREAMESEDVAGMIDAFSDLCETGVGDSRLFRAAAHASVLVEGFVLSRPDLVEFHGLAQRLDLFEWRKG